ncbi:MAG: Beta-galactosidase C-terminal domain [Propionicimonas sp.]|uniref:Beta-galactosidase C-terminal domain n=1 Tax=Propionicimonas sp. TaxID=1955623 RepID=UPI003D143A71
MLASFGDGELAGHPAALASADGRMRYLATVPDEAFLDAWVAGCLEAAGVPPFDGPFTLPIDGIEAARRGTTTFVTNLADEPRTVALTRACTDALTGERLEGLIALAPLGSLILEEGQK